MKRKYIVLSIVFYILTVLISCKKEEDKWIPKDPETTAIIPTDRFSDAAGNLMRRSQDPTLPDVNQAIDFDQEPFITQSLGPNGEIVKYYNFDMQALAPIPVYMLVNEQGETIESQLSIFAIIPGELTYNDFWQVYNVTVPTDYIANSICSYQDILDNELSILKTTEIVNCPIIPKGSTANLRLANESNAIQKAWCRDSIVYYFTFMEKVLVADELGLVPQSNIYVCFNKNPDTTDPTSGPPSGFVKEPGSNQTHNVIATIITDDDYSSLWNVQIYDNLYFDQVKDLETVFNTELVMPNAGFVNCPLVFVNN